MGVIYLSIFQTIRPTNGLQLECWPIMEMNICDRLKNGKNIFHSLIIQYFWISFMHLIAQIDWCKTSTLISTRLSFNSYNWWNLLGFIQQSKIMIHLSVSVLAPYLFVYAHFSDDTISIRIDLIFIEVFKWSCEFSPIEKWMESKKHKNKPPEPLNRTDLKFTTIFGCCFFIRLLGPAELLPLCRSHSQHVVKSWSSMKPRHKLQNDLDFSIQFGFFSFHYGQLLKTNGKNVWNLIHLHVEVNQQFEWVFGIRMLNIQNYHLINE